MGISNVMELTGKKTPQTITVRFRRGVEIWGGKDATERLGWWNGPHTLPADIASGLIATNRADRVEPGTKPDNLEDPILAKERAAKETRREQLERELAALNSDPAPEQRDPTALRTRGR